MAGTMRTYLSGRVAVHHGDSREVLRGFMSDSFDSVVCDPPYALVSIVKRFGGKNAAPTKDGDVYARSSAGFMGQAWDTGETAFAAEFWAEVMRVLKPGGHVLAFSGTRTYHRLACAIEDAGFEIRDMTAWIYGSGFPKSHDVSKGIDRAAGAERRVIAEGAPVKRMIPGADQNKAGWEKANGRIYIPTETVAGTPEAAEWQGWGTALKPALEPIVLARKPLIGTVAANVIEYGTGALNIDGCRVETDGRPLRVGDYKPTDSSVYAGRVNGGTGFDGGSRAVGTTDKGRWPANVIHDGSEEVLAAFPDAPGQQLAVGPEHGAKTSVNCYGDFGARDTFSPRNDSGSAARFFYTAKADSDDRIGSKHPTVKPVDLMRYLCRLVTPPGGMVLDPFAGTGTTGEAAWLEGFSATLIEREAQYVADIERRMSLCLAGPEEKARAIIKAKGKTEAPGPLFAELAT